MVPVWGRGGRSSEGQTKVCKEKNWAMVDVPKSGNK